MPPRSSAAGRRLCDPRRRCSWWSAMRALVRSSLGRAAARRRRTCTVLIPHGRDAQPGGDRAGKGGRDPIGAAASCCSREIFGGGEADQGRRISPSRAPQPVGHPQGLLQGGKTLQRFVTVPEGMPSIIVARALMKADAARAARSTVPAEGSRAARQLRYQSRRHPRGGARAHAEGDDRVSRQGLGASASRGIAVIDAASRR